MDELEPNEAHDCIVLFTAPSIPILPFSSGERHLRRLAILLLLTAAAAAVVVRPATAAAPTAITRMGIVRTRALRASREPARAHIAAALRLSESSSAVNPKTSR